MPQKLVIPKQDTRPPQKLEFEFSANIAERLKRVAAEGDHTISYVASFLLDQVLPPEETAAPKPEAVKQKHHEGDSVESGVTNAWKSLSRRDRAELGADRALEASLPAVSTEDPLRNRRARMVSATWTRYEASSTRRDGRHSGR